MNVNILGRKIHRGPRGGLYVLNGTRKIYKFTRATGPVSIPNARSPPKANGRNRNNGSRGPRNSGARRNVNQIPRLGPVSYIMDTMGRYVKWSDDIYAGLDEYIDNSAVVKIPFMGHRVGTRVQVEMTYTDGKVFVNGKLVKFIIAD